MPKSQVRKKKVYTPPTELQGKTTAASRKPSPVWIPATAVTLIFAGLIYLVAYYLTGGFGDIESLAVLTDLGPWNLAIGFGAFTGALFFLAKWR